MREISLLILLRGQYYTAGIYILDRDLRGALERTTVTSINDSDVDAVTPPTCTRV